MKFRMNLIAALVGAAFISTTVSAAVLEDIKTKKVGGAFVTELEFDQAVNIDDAKIEFINQTVQIDLPGNRFIEGKRLTTVKDPRVKSVFTYEPEGSLVRTRVIHNKEIQASALEGYVDVSQHGNYVRITVYDPDKHLPLKTQKAQQAAAEEEAAAEKELPVVKPINLVQQSQLSPSKVMDQRIDQALAAAESDQDQKPSVAKKERSEDQIPVFQNKSGEKKEAGSSAMALAYSFVVMIIMAGGIFALTRWWSGKQKKTLDTAKIKMMSQFHLGPKKSLAIVRVAGEYILLGVTDSNISMIKTLSLLEDDLVDEFPSDFSQTLKAKESSVESQDNFQPSSSTVSDISPEDLEVSSIKELVASKLKDLRPL